MDENGRRRQLAAGAPLHTPDNSVVLEQAPGCEKRERCAHVLSSTAGMACCIRAMRPKIRSARATGEICGRVIHRSFCGKAHAWCLGRCLLRSIGRVDEAQVREAGRARAG
ncbi:hypothetical protein JIQ42_01231 [Leishmania sp. Namibia]|uniref:hypothetical protein n=1 Tax=Leishmania sp. Namibia TaxID=2802991 RepID=UPI001B75D544|nr:hypothetical protein JIQ42_01231 [Leishmania sp. Namibia]